MKRTSALATLLLLSLGSPAWAAVPGVSIFGAKCGRCHVVGQGQALAETKPAFIDITLAARKHDEKWLMQFLQRPTSVSPDSGCLSKLDERSAREVFRYLRSRLKPAIPETLDSGGAHKPYRPALPPAPAHVEVVPVDPPKTQKHRRVVQQPGAQQQGVQK